MVTDDQRGISSAGKPKPAPEVTTFPLDDELVLYDPRSAWAYVLNATAARIWSFWDGSRSIASVARAIATTYALPYQQALADVRDLIAELCSAGLLVIERPGGRQAPDRN